MRKSSFVIDNDTSLTIQLLLLQAGDVETNPGPLSGVLKSFFKDLKSVQKKYESLGTCLHIPLEEIKAYEKMFKDDHERIFIAVINRWLFSHEGEDYVVLFANEKKEVDRICSTANYHKKDYVRILCKALMDIGEEELAKLLMKKWERQQSFLRCLQQDLLSVVDKYAIIGVQLEVELPVVNLFEAKYQNDKAAILANILQCWMDNYSRDSYIQDISAALGAVQEYNLAEVILQKYSCEANDGESSLIEAPITQNEECFEKQESVLSKAREDKKEVDGILESINLIPQLSVQDKEAEENGKCPQNLQEMQESSPHAYRVTLDITIPSKADIDDGSLKERMNKDGDKLYNIPENGGNIDWTDLEWSIGHDKKTSSFVTAKLCFLFRVQATTKSTITKGVKFFITEELDNQYSVDMIS